MKKQFLAALAALLLVGGGLLTGCQKEKPYSSYQFAVLYHGLPKNEQGGDLSPDEAEQRPAEQRDLYVVARYLDNWLVSNGYARTYGLGNALIIEGAELTINDQQAYNLYTNEVKRLDAVDLAKVIADAQRETGSSKLTLTTSGSLEIDYVVTGITTLPKAEYPQSKEYKIPYFKEPQTSNPE